MHADDAYFNIVSIKHDDITPSAMTIRIDQAEQKFGSFVSWS